MGIRKVGAAVFLDRDGVINRLVFNPKTREYESPHAVKDFRLLPGVLAALQQLQAKGWKLFLISNQPSYAKGKTTLEAIKAIHARLHQHLEVSGIHFAGYYYCYHHPRGIVPGFSRECACRKPKPYFVLRALKQYGLIAKKSWLIGDQDSDIFCGQAAGINTILIQSGPARAKRGQSRPEFFAPNLPGAVKILI